MNKIVLLILLLTTSSYTCAHGSSYPATFDYDRVGNDLIQTRVKGSSETVHVYYNYYAPDRVEARKVAEIERRKEAAKRRKSEEAFSKFMIIPFIALLLFGIYMIFFFSDETKKIDKKADSGTPKRSCCVCGKPE